MTVPPSRRRRSAIAAAVALALPLAVGIAPAQAAQPVRASQVVGGEQTTVYEVTITNLTDGQPMSPPVAATHDPSLHVFQVGQPASDPVAAVAQDGDPVPLFTAASSDPAVTDAVNVGRPLTPRGTTAMGFDDTASLRIEAAPGDVFSLATMLICTNDGLTGLDGVAMPATGSATFDLEGYDAGRERNTEQSTDLVDPCSGLGPVALPGDPDGNVDDAVATTPPEPIADHPGIAGTGELVPAEHQWRGPVARVTVTAVETTDYVVSIENLTDGQPMSPVVAATHEPSFHAFQVGQPASDPVAAVARDGDPVPLFMELGASPAVTDAVNLRRPLPPGTTAMGFAPSALFTVSAVPGDVFSLATMLICTNDGLTGLDGVAMPATGSATFDLEGYDAGRERNTEQSTDLVDPCSGLGPVALPGDPDGNVDDAVATTPPEPIADHPGIAGTGELVPAEHQWRGPVARVTISPLANAFADDDTSVHAHAIDVLAAAGMVDGRGDGAFAPVEPVTRGQVASMLVRALDLSATTTDAFSDDGDSVHQANINALAAAGVTTGCGDGRFCPDDPMTRSQMATLLVAALSIPPSATDAFGDDDGIVHEAAIDALAAVEVTTGCEPDRFCPERPVLRGQLASLVARALGPAAAA